MTGPSLATRRARRFGGDGGDAGAFNTGDSAADTWGGAVAGLGAVAVAATTTIGSAAGAATAVGMFTADFADGAATRGVGVAAGNQTDGARE